MDTPGLEFLLVIKPIVDIQSINVAVQPPCNPPPLFVIPSST